MKVIIKPNGKGKNAKMINRVSISSRDTWSLDYTLAKVILPALKKYKKIGAARVTWGCMVENPFQNSTAAQRAKENAKMMTIIDEMIYAFSIISTDKYFSITKTEQKQVQKGLNLFAKYYMSLWW